MGGDEHGPRASRFARQRHVDEQRGDVVDGGGVGALVLHEERAANARVLRGPHAPVEKEDRRLMVELLRRLRGSFG
jgi:hypothetical protein